MQSFKGSVRIPPGRSSSAKFRVRVRPNRRRAPKPRIGGMRRSVKSGGRAANHPDHKLRSARPTHDRRPEALGSKWEAEAAGGQTLSCPNQLQSRVCGSPELRVFGQKGRAKRPSTKADNTHVVGAAV